MSFFQSSRTVTLASLADRVLFSHDEDAAVALAKMLLERKDPPDSFEAFVALVPGILGHMMDNGGRMTVGVFNVLSDGYDAARHVLEAERLEKIPTLKENP